VHGLSNPISNVFNYSLTQDPGNPAVVSGMPSAFDVAVAGSPDANGDVQVVGGVDLSNLNFTALGDYKFVVKETGTADSANFPVDSEKEYYYYVSVRNKFDSAHNLTGEYIAVMSSQVRDHDAGDKMDAVFESTAPRAMITVTNEVSGNLANVDDYFKYKITFEGANDGDVFTVTGQDTMVSYGGENIATSNKITVGGDDYIYLKHGQTVYIGANGEKNELPIDIKYSLEEVDANGYVQYVDGVAGNTSRKKTISALENAVNNKVAFLNHKEGNVLTGVMIDVLPYILAIGVAGAIAVICLKKKSKQRKTKC